MENVEAEQAQKFRPLGRKITWKVISGKTLNEMMNKIEIGLTEIYFEDFEWNG
jgi:hypothetical protein